MTLVVMPEECQSIPILRRTTGTKTDAPTDAATRRDHTRLGDRRAQPGHAIAQPFHAATVKRQIGTAGTA
jgi:hypothetical protein